MFLLCSMRRFRFIMAFISQGTFSFKNINVLGALLPFAFLLLFPPISVPWVILLPLSIWTPSPSELCRLDSLFFLLSHCHPCFLNKTSVHRDQFCSYLHTCTHIQLQLTYKHKQKYAFTCHENHFVMAITYKRTVE